MFDRAGSTEGNPTVARKPGARAFTGTLVTNLALQACGAVSGILAARLLGVQLRGQLAALILWPTVIASLGILGTNWSTARAAASSERDAGEVAGTAIALALALSVLSVAAGWFLLPLLLTSRPQLVPIARLYMLCWIPISYVGLNLLALDQGRGNFFRYNWTRALLSPVYIAAILVLWAAGHTTVVGFAVALLAGNAAVVAVRLVCLARDPFPVRFSLGRGSALLQSGLPFAVSAVAILLAAQLDRMIVVSFLDDRQVGLYVVAVAFAMIFRGVATSLGAVTFSRSAQTGDFGELSSFVTQTFRRSLLLGIATGSAAAVLAPLVIVPVYGTEFRAAALPCVFLALASVFLAPATFMDESLRGQGKPLYGVLIKFGAAAVILAGAALLVPAWGIIGLAVAVLCGGACQALAFSFVGRRVFAAGLVDLWLPRAVDFKYLFVGMVRSVGQLAPRQIPGEPL